MLFFLIASSTDCTYQVFASSVSLARLMVGLRGSTPRLELDQLAEGGGSRLGHTDCVGLLLAQGGGPLVLREQLDGLFVLTTMLILFKVGQRVR